MCWWKSIGPAVAGAVPWESLMARGVYPAPDEDRAGRDPAPPGLPPLRVAAHLDRGGPGGTGGGGALRRRFGGGDPRPRREPPAGGRPPGHRRPVDGDVRPAEDHQP